jgi:hypothetical protein
MSTQALHLTVFGALVICSFRCRVRYLALYFIVYISDPLWFTWNAQPNLSIRLFVLLYPNFILRIGEQNFTEYDSGEFYQKINYPLQFAFRSDNYNHKLTSKCDVCLRTSNFVVKLLPRDSHSCSKHVGNFTGFRQIEEPKKIG